MASRKIGGYAEQSIIATQMAQMMQAEAVEYIRDQYYVEPEEKKFDITNMALTDLVSAVERAIEDGTLDQLNAQFTEQIIQVVMQQQGQ